MMKLRRYISFMLIASFLAIGLSINPITASAESSDDYDNKVQLLYSLGIVDDNFVSLNHPDSSMTSGIVKNTVSLFKGILSDYEDDETVTMMYAVKELLNAMGYMAIMDIETASDIEYWHKAASIGLVKNTIGSVDGLLTAADFVSMLTNALNIEFLKIDSIINGEYQYTFGETYLQQNKIAMTSGIVYSNYVTSLEYSGGTKKGFVVIDDMTYNVGKTDISNYLGYNMLFWYKYIEDEKVILHARPTQNETLTILSDDIDGLTAEDQFCYFAENKSKVAKLDDEYCFLYNSVVMLKKDPSLLKPELGYITLIDNNNDRLYDVVSVKSYVVYTVEGLDTIYKKLYVKNGDEPLDFDDEDKVLSMSKNGTPATFGSYALGDILYVAKSKTGDYFSVDGSDVEVGGVVSEIYTEGDKTYYVIDEAAYQWRTAVSTSFDFLNKEVILSLGPTGLVEDIDIKRSDKYALLLGAEKEEGLSGNYLLKVFNENGQTEILKLAKKSYLYSDTYDNTQIKDAEILYLSRYANDCIMAPAQSMGLGIAAPIIMYTMQGEEVKTVSLPVVCDAEKSGNEREQYTFQAATTIPEMVNKQSKNLFFSWSGAFNPILLQTQSDGAYKYLNKDTVVFHVPTNTKYQLEEGYEKQSIALKGSQFSGHSWMHNSFYNLNEDHTIGVMVNYYIDDESAEGSKIFLVNKANPVLVDGTKHTKVTGIYDGKTDVSFVISEDAKIDNSELTKYQNTKERKIEDMKKGDCFLFATDLNGRIKYIKMLVTSDNNDFNRYHNEENYEGSNEIAFGTVDDVYGDLLTIEVDENASSPSQLLCYAYRYKTANIYLYDRKYNTVRIIDYKSIIKDDVVMTNQYTGTVRDILVIR